MTTNDSEKSPAPRTKSHAGLLAVLFVGLAVALAGNVFQFVKTERMSRDMVLTQQHTQGQIAKLTDAAAATLEENQQRFEALKAQLQETGVVALRQARSEARKTGSKLQRALDEKNQELDRKHEEMVSQLSDLKQDTSTRLSKVSGDLDQTGSDVQRVRGDLDAVSGEVATNAKELASLKELGQRNYFEFDLTKTRQPQKVGNIRLLLKKTDPKRSRYTLVVLADDKQVEKRDRTINEPVVLYVAGSRQPYEIVVNQVKKNEVIGYLATPKIKPSRSQASD